MATTPRRSARNAASASPKPASSPKKSKASTPRGGEGGLLWSFVYVSVFVVALLAVAFKIRHDRLGAADRISPIFAALSLYLVVNILICLWEIVLWFKIEDIQKLSKHYHETVPRGNMPSPLFLFAPVTLARALDPEYWTDVWASYSLLDISYTQTGSFGWCIDVGNGWSTIIPSLVMLLGMSDLSYVGNISARNLGFFSAWFLWQAMYGTYIYYLQYIVNKRWRDTSTEYYRALVTAVNFPWVAGTGLGLYCSWRMVTDNNLSVFA